MPDEPIDAEIVPEPAPAPPVTGYTDSGVPTLDYVRDKIEGRYATALGMEELVGDTDQARSPSRRPRARRPPRRSWRRSAAPSAGLPPEQLAAQPHQRVVLAVDRALLQRDQRVVSDLDVLRAHLGAALGDVAVAQAVLFDGLLRAPGTRVERVHGQLGLAHEVARPGERGLVLLVVAHHVAGVLAQVALDALAELLAPLDVDLLHPVLARRHAGRRRERRDLPGLRVVELHVGDEVADHRERAQRRDRDDV